MLSEIRTNMENMLTHTQTHTHTRHVHFHLNCTNTIQRESKITNNFFLKPHFAKPFAKFPTLTTQIPLVSIHPSPPPPPPPSTDAVSDTKHTTLLVETYHLHRGLRVLLSKLEGEDSDPLRILGEDGDWPKEYFWAVVKFLRRASRFSDIVQVFDMWKNIEISRHNELNYNKIISLLGEEGMMEDAVSALHQMKTYGLKPSLETYNPIIHGFSREGKFGEALNFLEEMKEFGLAPDTETYDGLIRAYGKFKMYDEISKCVKKMELDGCSPDHITYNILIQEYACSGVIQRMEKLYHRMVSKRMPLQSSTFVAMLEAYATFGIIEKMEKLYRKLLNSKTWLHGDLIRKLAQVYIKNYMFSRLEDLGLELHSAFGGSDLVWCLRLLSYACLLSRKGMDIIVREMEQAKFRWNVTIANIMMLAYVKMKDFKNLRILLSQLPIHQVKPDIVTIGIIIDANRIGFDGSAALETWRRMGYLYRAVEMDTDSLVLAAFGKGHFLKSCEEAYSSLSSEDRERKTWTYYNLIALVSKHGGSIDCNQNN